TVANGVLRKFLARWALSPAQLAAIWAIVAVSCGIAHTGLMHMLVPQLPAYQYYASAENNWDELFGDKVPSELLIHDPHATRAFYEGLAPGLPIPWGVWLKPMAVWTLYVAGMYMMMIGASVILRRQWVDHERLVFPVVQLPLEIVQAPERGYVFNSMLRNRLFWLGVLIPLLFHGWNFLATMFPSLPKMKNYGWVGISERPWSALSTWVVAYFLMVGLGYLISSEICFSLWFFHLVYDAQAVIVSMVGMPDTGLFIGWSAGGWAQMQQAGGTVALVASFVWLGRRHFAQVFRQAFSAAPKAYDAAEPLHYRAAVWLLVLGCAVMVGWLFHYGGSLPLAMFNVALGVGVFVTFAWMVCQGGAIYTMQNFASTSAIVNMTGSRLLGEWPVFINLWNENMFRMLMLREFFMPSLINAFKLSDEVNLDRRSLLKACIVAIVLGFLVAAASKIATAYVMGGVFSFFGHTYYWEQVPTTPFKIMSSLVTTPVPHSPWYIGNFLGGFFFVAALIWTRTRLNWLGLHPIGFIVAKNNQSERIMWPSFLIAWVIKNSVMRWGGYKTYMRLRPLFLGLIAGDTVTATGTIILGWLTNTRHNVLPG
ncbi:MAG: hypothetical protein KAW89_07115, partial [Armatimonadetes bacterium]|nr:hypothetical protein [Armatimonadota bacterium]